MYRCLFRDDHCGWERHALLDHWRCVSGESPVRFWCSGAPLTYSRRLQKNVYSVFRYNPASVGFAALSEVAIAENGVNGAAPTPTIGSVAAAVTNASSASPGVRIGLGRGVVTTVVGSLVTMMLWML